VKTNIENNAYVVTEINVSFLKESYLARVFLLKPRSLNASKPLCFHGNTVHSAKHWTVLLH